MDGVPTLEALNAHLASRAAAYGLHAEASIVDGAHSVISLDGMHIRATLTKAALPRPLTRIHQVSVHRFEQIGVSVFDAFVDTQAPALVAE